jgi:hypothetical protein
VKSSTKEEKRQGSGVASADRSGTPGGAVMRRSFFVFCPHFVFDSTEKHRTNYAARGGIPQQLHEK